MQHLCVTLLAFERPDRKCEYAWPDWLNVWLSKAPGSAVDSRDRIINRNKRKVKDLLFNVI